MTSGREHGRILDMNFTIPMFAAAQSAKCGPATVIGLILAFIAVGIFLFPGLIPNLANTGLFLSKGHRKVLFLLKRYVAWKGSLLPEGTKYSGISIRNGDLYAKRYRKVLGERIYVSERILSSMCTKRKDAILEFLDQAMKEAKCKTPEELSIFLESAGF